MAAQRGLTRSAWLDYDDLPDRFNPAKLGADDKRIRRRVRRILAFRAPADLEQLVAAWEIARINEVDMRLAEAMERGTVDDETTERVHDVLDRRLQQLFEMLPPELHDAARDLLVPEWLDGHDIHPMSFIRIGTGCSWRRGRERAPRRPVSRRQRTRARSPGSSSNGEDSEPRLADARLVGGAV